MPPYKICPNCGKYAYHSMTEKIYICFSCGHKIPDIVQWYVGWGKKEKVDANK